MHLTFRCLIAIALLGAGCAEQAVEPGSRLNGPATVTIRLQDAAGDIRAAVVTISEVYLQGTGGRTVLRNTPCTVDLVSLATTSTVLLENVQVDAGSYGELRFVVTGAYIAVEQAGGGTRIFASTPDYSGLPPGAVVDGTLQMPSFGTSGLKVQLPDGMLTVPASGVVSLVVDFDVAQSFGHQAGNSGKWVMHPVITATNVTQGTTLTVTLVLGAGVTLPAGVTLGDFAATLAAASAPDQGLASVAFSSDAGGSYKAALGFVAPGSYLVNLVVPGTVGGVTVSPSVPYAYTAVAGPGTTLALTVTAVTAKGFVLASVATGEVHTCGLTPTGAAYCWGANDQGELGNGSTAGSSSPVAVSGGHTFTALRVGSFNSCGVATGGAAYCWGDNEIGQLGNGSSTGPQQCLGVACAATPVPVSGGLTFATVSLGMTHSCGLTTGGAAYCWGDNSVGELGNGSTANSSVPAAVSGGHTFATITAGFAHTCALTATGAAYCWGSNTDGELGNGSNTNSSAPVAVSGGLAFARVGPGSGHTCAVTTGHAAYCWGRNDWGQLGNGSNTGSNTPVAVAGGLNLAAVSAGAAHTCALTTGGAAYCWGANIVGELGNGSTIGPQQCSIGTSSYSCARTPVAVSGGLTLAAVSAGGDYNCALTTGGAAYCWGINSYGQLGNGSSGNASSVPAPVSNP